MSEMVVIKIGGSAGINWDHVIPDVVQLLAKGQRLVLIHGGSHLTNEVATALGHPPTFVTSPSGYTSRYTDRAALEIFEMVYCGQVNKNVVERLQRQGVNAIGLSGIDGGLWRGPLKKTIRVVENGRTRILRGNLTGKVTEVNVSLLHNLLENGFLPVLTPPAISLDGIAMNVDGDRAAAATAVALQAQELLILSNVPGVLNNPSNEASLIPAIHVDELEEAARAFARGRMRIKLLGAQEALAGGVGRVMLGDARDEKPILRTLAGAGTLIGRW